MMISDHARKTGLNTPIQPESAAIPNKQALVFLDDARSSNQAAVDAFVMMDTGTPCLRILSGTASAQRPGVGAAKMEVCNLKHPGQIMKAGVRLLDGTHPDADRETRPPLLRALCGLMKGLGGLRSS